MATNILIIGESGSGKSASFRNMDQKSTFILAAQEQPFPFKGWRKILKDTDTETANYYSTRNPETIVRVIKKISDEKPHIKTLVIDDFQYVMSLEFMDRALERGYDKFNEIAKHIVDIIQEAGYVRADLKVVFLAHSDNCDDGKTRMKTIGKLLNEKITIEGMFTIVFNSIIKDGEYCFATQSDGKTVAKSPMGMFEERFVPNDLKEVLAKVDEYYDEDVPF